MRKIIVMTASVFCLSIASSSIAFAIDWQQFKGTKLGVIANLNSRNEGLEKLLPEFEKLTGMKVDFVMGPQKELRDKFVPALAVGSSIYDMIWFNEHELPGFASAGWVQPLDKFMANPEITDAEVLDWEGFVPAYKRAVRYKDEIWGIPSMGEAGLLLYRTDLFEKYGMGPPHGSWEDLIQIGKKMTLDTNGDGKTDVYGLTFRGGAGLGLATGFVWTPLLKSYGGSYFDENWKPTINSPEAVEATEIFIKLAEWTPPGFTSYTWYDVYTGMSQGYAAVAIESTCILPGRQDPKTSVVAGKVDVSAWPVGPVGCYPQSWVAMYGITVASKNPEAAWLFAQWATSSEVVEKTYDLGYCEGGPPHLSNYKSLPKFGYNTPHAMQVFANAMKLADPNDRPMIPEIIQVSRILSTSITEAVGGIKSIKGALDEANEEIYDIMKDAGYYE